MRSNLLNFANLSYLKIQPPAAPSAKFSSVMVIFPCGQASMENGLTFVATTGNKQEKMGELHTGSRTGISTGVRQFCHLPAS